MHDIAIRSAYIEDGSGSPPFLGDIAIEGDRIAGLGDIGKARFNIEAEGLVAAPGFIDAHTHDDAEMHHHPDNRAKIRQGVTTVVCGNCGFSAFPHQPPQPSPDLLSTTGGWQNYEEYTTVLSDHGIGTNVANIVGHNTVARLLCGIDSNEPTQRELTAIHGEISRAVSSGALGGVDWTNIQTGVPLQH